MSRARCAWDSTAQGHVESYSGDRVELQRAHPSPEGRFVNAEGNGGTIFSFNFPPVAESSVKAVERHVKGGLEDPHSAAFSRCPTRRTFPPPAGELTLTIPAGWQQSAEKMKIDPIESGGESTCTFRIRSLPLAAAKRILPLVAHYQGEAVKSTPATEMVWWGNRQKEPGKTDGK
jgi:hypothetical protein